MARLFQQQKEIPPVMGIVGFSGSGKTTLMVKLIAELARCGLKIGTIKHDVHGFEMDQPGKDTWRHKRAGAAATLISSPHQIGLVMDVDQDQGLEALLPLFSGKDLVLTEGYKSASIPKIEVYREPISEKRIGRDDPHVVAYATNADFETDKPRFDPDDVQGLAAFITDYLFAGKKRPPVKRGQMGDREIHQHFRSRRYQAVNSQDHTD